MIQLVMENHSMVSILSLILILYGKIIQLVIHKVSYHQHFWTLVLWTSLWLQLSLEHGQNLVGNSPVTLTRVHQCEAISTTNDPPKGRATYYTRNNLTMSNQTKMNHAKKAFWSWTIGNCSFHVGITNGTRTSSSKWSTKRQYTNDGPMWIQSISGNTLSQLNYEHRLDWSSNDEFTMCGKGSKLREMIKTA